ncbi:MAG: hypothetical protein JSR58_04000 [Verrucomicrobia bacterium]|nr:hypothetical protein [Verrucomicrobiota bacterium]
MTNNNRKKYTFESELIKLVIKEDRAGYYLFIFKDLSSPIPTEDYLYSALDEVFEMARREYGVAKDQWVESTFEVILRD